MSAFTKWVTRLNDTETPWTENEVIYFRKAIGHCGLKDPSERAYLISKFQGCYRITRNHDVRGQAYLISKSIKVNGARRKGCKLSDSDLKILKELDHHVFVGLHPQANRMGHVLSYLPIYRAIAIGGDWFDYVGATYEMVVILGRSEPVSPRLKLVSSGVAK